MKPKKQKAEIYNINKLEHVSLEEIINKIFTPWFITIIDFGAISTYPIMLFETTPLRDIFIVNYISELFSETEFFSHKAQLIIITIIYINRFKNCTRNKYGINRIFTFTNFTAVFIIALLLASKFLLDNPPKNIEIKDYVYGDNISLPAFNMLERLFLNIIEFNIFVSSEEYYIWTC